ncbi:MAG TPA: hypothetical protein VGN22_15970 [Pseudonocardia sp.]|jgi:hypothetical protein
MNGTMTRSEAQALRAHDAEHAAAHPLTPMIRSIARVLFSLDDDTHAAIRANHKQAVELVNAINSKPTRVLFYEADTLAGIQALAKALYRR